MKPFISKQFNTFISSDNLPLAVAAVMDMCALIMSWSYVVKEQEEDDDDEVDC